MEQIPERHVPRKFDLVGASHQIFHVLTLLAGLAHFFGILRAFENARTDSCEVAAPTEAVFGATEGGFALMRWPGPMCPWRAIVKNESKVE